MSVSTSPGAPNRRSAAANARHTARPVARITTWHAEPGMIIDTGHELGLGPVGQEDPADQVHLPQRHRGVPLPPHVTVPRPLARLRLDQPVPDQGPGRHSSATAPHSPRPGPARAPAAADPTADAPAAARTPLSPPPRRPGAGTTPGAGTGPSARPARPAHNGGPTRARSAATRQTGQRPPSPELPPPPPAQPGTAARPPTTRPVPIPASRPMPPANDMRQPSRIMAICKASGGTAVTSIYRDRTTLRARPLPN